MRVALGMSGGVDSTAAACLLREAGHTVVGVTMQLWDGAEQLMQKSAVPGRPGCYGPEEPARLERVRALAARLGIEYYIVPLVAEFRRQVLDYVRNEYCAGRTPNPCVFCNRALKFTLLPERLQKLGVAFDAFATGHYARVEFCRKTNTFQLKRGLDRTKDQSYFLFYLNQTQLKNLLLPLGDLTKKIVRRLVSQYGLAEIVETQESQDFLGAEGYTVLFKGENIRPGPVVEEKTGRVIGTHRGIAYYTIGQREGVGVAAGRPLYVKALIPETNTVMVGEREEIMNDVCQVQSVHWIAGQPSAACINCQVQVRYRHAGAQARIEVLDKNKVCVRFDEPQFAVTPGQAAVFYLEDMVLGGGIIS